MLQTVIKPSAPAAVWLRRAMGSSLLDHQGLSYYLEEMNPLWSLSELRARVLAVVNETHDTKTFLLKSNWQWPGFTAGQNIGVNIEIDGVTHKRRYSVSCAQTRAREFSITVKRVPGGRVSNWMHDHVQPGDVLRLNPPAGDFVLPAALPAKILMLAAGSGITPLMSQLQTLLAGGFEGDIEFLHYVRSPGDHIFGARLKALAAKHSNLRVHWCEEDDGQGAAPERFSAGQIAGRVADYRERHTMLCGPAGFMAAVREHWQEEGLNARLQFEYFGAPPVTRAAGDSQAAVTLARKGRALQAQGGQSLLEALETGGETPAHGCRMGICHECSCRKTAGRVRNVLTGELSGEGEQNIQLCISVAESDVVLDY